MDHVVRFDFQSGLVSVSKNYPRETSFESKEIGEADSEAYFIKFSVKFSRRLQKV